MTDNGNNDSGRRHDLDTIWDGDGAPLTVTKVDGMYYPPIPGIADRVREANSFIARGDDVWIVGYPKCGCHWTYDIITMVLAGSARDVAENKDDGFIEMVSFSTLAEMSSPRLMNTHFQVDRFPKDVLAKKCKIVLNIRNPKDVCVSMFHHQRKVKFINYSGGFNGFLKMFIQGNGTYNSWYDNTLGWYEYSKTHPEVLALNYEDMIKDLPAAVEAIAEHLGRKLSVDVCRDIARQCSFDVMKDRKKKIEPKAYLKEDSDQTLYRKGKVGDWKNVFTVAQNEEFERVHQEKMKQTDLEIDFDL